METFKKRAKTAFPQSEEENLLDLCCILSPWRCTVVHSMSVLQTPRFAQMIFLGDALDEPLKGGCTRGRMHSLFFPKYLLYIHDLSHNKPPIYGAQVAHILHFLLLNKSHGKKAVPPFPSSVQRRQSSRGRWKTVIKPVAPRYISAPLLFCISLSIKIPSCYTCYTSPPPTQGGHLTGGNDTLGAGKDHVTFGGKAGKFWRNHTQRGSFALKLI